MIPLPECQKILQNCIDMCDETLQSQDNLIDALSQENADLSVKNDKLKKELESKGSTLPWIITSVVLGLATGTLLTVDF